MTGMFWQREFFGERTTTSNPYEPFEAHDRDSASLRPHDGSRIQLATTIGGIGCCAVTFICAIGHFVAVMVLEASFSPPLRAQENFGQFGFLTVYVGFFGGLYGLSLGLIPYTRFIGWLPLFVLISLFAGFAEPIESPSRVN